MIFEYWRPVRGYVGLYLVSDRGRIKSLITGKILKQKKDKYGYMVVRLYKEGVGKSHTVHRLVMQSFKYDCPSGFEVDHRDFNPENNSIENLRYLTKSENSARKSDETLQRISSIGKNRSEEDRKRSSELLKTKWKNEEFRKRNIERVKNKTEEWRKNIAITNKSLKSKQVVQIEKENGIIIKLWNSLSDITRELGYPQSCISRCCKQKQKTAYGYVWRYYDEYKNEVA